MIDLAEGERLNRERTQGPWIQFVDRGSVYGVELLPAMVDGRIARFERDETFDASDVDANAAFIAWSANNMDALLSTTRDAVALREKVERLEAELHAAKRLLNLTKALLDDANAAEREALDIVASLFDDACSLGCPSTGREGVPIPHTERCERARTALHRLEDKEA